jgi:PPP family 3-phenylpropionic acid transporter
MSLMSATRQVHWRLSFFFFAVFLVPGVQMPYWPLWLKDRGFGAEQVGTLLFAYALGRTTAAPLLGQLADRLGSRRQILLSVCLLIIPLTTLHALAGGSFATQLILHVIGGLLIAAVIPLADNMTLMAEQSGQLDYARVRAWGSKGFIVASLLCGLLISGNDSARVLPLLLLAMGLMLFAAWCLPDIRTPVVAVTAVESTSRLGALFGNRTLMLGILCSGLIQGSHGVLYGFATLHWREAGHSEAMIGLLWTEGVLAEILLFYAATRWLTRWSAAQLMLAGALASVLRWVALSITSELSALLVLQVLHALTFGATHLGAMRLLREAVPAQHSATAQTLHAAVVGGLFMGGSYWLAGHAWAELGSQAFLLMVVPGIAGSLAAWHLLSRPQSTVSAV